MKIETKPIDIKSSLIKFIMRLKSSKSAGVRNKIYRYYNILRTPVV